MSKKTQNVYIFCFHGNGTNWPSEIWQNSCISNANYLVSVNRNMDYVNKFWQVYICLAKRKKMKIMKLFKYRLPWQPNHQIPSDFTEKEHIHSKVSPLNKGSNWLFMHILCNQHLIIDTKIKFTNELSQFMLPWQSKHHTISDFTKMAYSAKRAYSKQIISFQHDRIWIEFNIF